MSARASYQLVQRGRPQPGLKSRPRRRGKRPRRWPSPSSKYAMMERGDFFGNGTDWARAERLCRNAAVVSTSEADLTLARTDLIPGPSPTAKNTLLEKGAFCGTGGLSGFASGLNGLRPGPGAPAGGSVWMRVARGRVQWQGSNKCKISDLIPGPSPVWRSARHTGEGCLIERWR